MMILRLCLKDKSSVLIKYPGLTQLQRDLNLFNFVQVENLNTGKMEVYNRDYIWSVRISSQNKEGGREIWE